MATAKKLPSGAYRVLVYSHKDKDGKRHYESFTAPTKKEAEMMGAEFAAKKNRLSKSDLTVIEAVNGYISLKSSVLSPSSIRGYKTTLKWFDLISNIKIKRLDNKTVQEFIGNMSSNGLSPKTVRNIYGLFTSAVNLYAPEMVFHVTLPQKAHRLKKAPSDEKVHQIYEKSHGELKKAIYLGFFGVRRGEVCIVEYSDIENNLLHIHRDMILGSDGWEVKEIPKTSESERYVLLPGNYKEVLGTGTGRIVNLVPGTITNSFRLLTQSLNIDIHFHDLRHYFASMAHAMGIPDQYIMSMGGWKSDSVMKSIYRNSIDDIERKYRSIFADKIGEWG